MRAVAALVVVWFGLCTVETAEARAPDPIRDCVSDGILDGTYPKSVLLKALRDFPADQREYSDCEQQLSAGLMRSSGRGPRAGASGSVPQSADSDGDGRISRTERMAYESARARRQGRRPGPGARNGEPRAGGAAGGAADRENGGGVGTGLLAAGAILVVAAGAATRFWRRR